MYLVKTYKLGSVYDIDVFLIGSVARSRSFSSVLRVNCVVFLLTVYIRPP